MSWKGRAARLEIHPLAVPTLEAAELHAEHHGADVADAHHGACARATAVGLLPEGGIDRTGTVLQSGASEHTLQGHKLPDGGRLQHGEPGQFWQAVDADADEPLRAVAEHQQVGGIAAGRWRGEERRMLAGGGG